MTAAASKAQRLGSAELTLLSFEQNELATPFYRRLNFEVIGRSSVIPHPSIHYTGDLLLMRRSCDWADARGLHQVEMSACWHEAEVRPLSTSADPRRR